MAAEHSLEKTNRMNLLFDFYRSLLTDKQQTFMQCYFHDDLSLGEIAAEFEISRQAVYEHIKRAELMLEDYERKLKLLANHEQRAACGEQMRELISGVAEEQRRTLLARKLDEMMQI